MASALRHSRLIETTENQIVVGVQGNGFQMELAEKQENRTLIEADRRRNTEQKIDSKIRLLPAAVAAGCKNNQKKGRPDEQDPAVQEVLKVFTEGEVIEQDHLHE